MWGKQQDGDEEQRHDFDDSSKTKTLFQYDDQSFSWEEQAFAEDAAAAGRLGGCVWPPRSYSCSFCRREFRSAQALGGHMNVHRRDRARLKQSPNIIVPNNNHLCSTLAFDHHLHPNPKLPYSANRSPGVISCGGCRSDSTVGKDDKLGIISCPRVRDKDHIGIETGVSFGFGQFRSTSGLFDDGREAEAVASCKRRKMDDESSINFYVKSSSLVERRHHQRHHNHPIQPEVIGLSSNSLHDLDLELRLGGFSKG